MPTTGPGTVSLVRTDLGDTILLANPRRRNALTLDMWRRLGELTGTLPPSPEPLYVVGAAGYFCSGADLAALRHARTTREHAAEFGHAVVTSLLGLHLLEREVVAVVEGGAAGGGVEIMAACDSRVAVGDPSLVFPFGQHGMALDDLTRWRLEQLVGPEQTGRLLQGRQVLTTDEAAALGLFDARVDSLDQVVAAGPAGTWAAPGATPGRYPVGRGHAALQDAVRRAAAPMLAALAPDPRP